MEARMVRVVGGWNDWRISWCCWWEFVKLGGDVVVVGLSKVILF